MTVRQIARLLTAALVVSSAWSSHAETCTVKRGNVGPTAVAVADLGVIVDGRHRTFVRFSTPLQVTTDGAPNSYFLADPTSRSGLNTICNAAPAYLLSTDGKRVRRLSCPETLAAFAAFRDSGWVEPPGIELDWQAGLMSDPLAPTPRPCVFSYGPYKGYIASATRLKNGVSDKGECAINDQVDPLHVNGLTIKWGESYLRASGVQIGDLAIISWKAPGGGMRRQAAVVVDSGGANPAMGTIALNSALLGRSGLITTHAEALGLVVRPPATVTIIPGSSGYALARPFTNDNILQRISSFAVAAGFESLANLEERAGACANSSG